jgi:hypothetical protein
VKLIKVLGLLGFLLLSSTVFAQVTDKEKKSIRIPAEPSKTEKDSSLIKAKVAPIPKVENNSSGTNTDKSQKKYSIRETERPFSMIENDGLISPSEIFEQRWKKEAAKGGIVRTMSDQFLGEHRVDTKFVNIVCRDHEYPDGDRVKSCC